MGKFRKRKGQSARMGSRKEGLEGLRRRAAVFLCAAAAIVYTACGAESTAAGSMVKSEAGNAYDSENSFYYDNYSEAEEAPIGNTAGMEGSEILDGRKLIETVNLEVETRQFEEMISLLETQIQSMNGYIERMDSYNGSSYSDYRSLRYANLTIRLPGRNLNGFLTAVSDAGNVVRSSKSVDDVTLSYVDMESRRNTLQKEQERLIAFLDRAETIEEIITIEERLSEVRYRLESMESQLRTIDNLVEYSTVYLKISEVETLTPVEEPSVGARISEGFMESLHSVGNGAMELGIWILIHIPYLIIWGVLIALVVLLCIRQRRKRRKSLESRLWRPVSAPAGPNASAESQTQQDKKEESEPQSGPKDDFLH
ncbi:MAG: DUF4349 domain-containing protein [Lachnospiraceae bacterium]|nr:DUF4349 domain-containing protein [Lachnospiraceae bacterium]